MVYFLWVICIWGCISQVSLIVTWKGKVSIQTFMYYAWYCCWKKSCTTWHVWNPVNNGMFTIATVAGFLPSTASWMMCGHRKVHVAITCNYSNWLIDTVIPGATPRQKVNEKTAPLPRKNGLCLPAEIFHWPQKMVLSFDFWYFLIWKDHEGTLHDGLQWVRKKTGSDTTVFNFRTRVV